MFMIRTDTGRVLAAAASPHWLDFRVIRFIRRWEVAYRADRYAWQVASVSQDDILDEYLEEASAFASYKVRKGLVESLQRGAFNKPETYPYIKVEP